MKKVMLIFALTMLLGFSFSVDAAYHHEGEADSQNFIADYPALEGSKLDSCALCHSGGQYEKKPGVFVEVGSCQWCHDIYGYDGSGNIEDTLNPYGIDYRNAGRSAGAVSSIEGNDSDGDTYSNKQEIDALSYPGDADDDPTKVPAPRVTYTMSDLESFTPHTQFLLMNTSRSGDFYTEYQGVTLLDLLKDAGMIEESTTAVTVYAPDGFSYTYELKAGGEYYYIDGTYPQATFYYDAEADSAYGGWCDYSAPSCLGRQNGEVINVVNELKLILAYKRDGAYLEDGVLNEENKLDGEGPFRSVPPQMVVGPPDQLSTSEIQDVIWPYDEDADHNAGFSARTVVAIRVEPLPEGTTDFNWYEGGWDYVDDKEVIIYGNLESCGVQGTVTDQATTLPIEKAAVSTTKGGYSTVTDASGNYGLTGMKTGSYTLRVSAIGYQTASQTISVSNGTTETVNVVLTPGSSDCPIHSTLADDKAELALLRKYRDKVLLQNNLGKQYVKNYYAHAAEVTKIFLLHSGLRAQAKEVLKTAESSIERVMQGGELSLTKTQWEQVKTLARELKKVGSEELNKTLSKFEKDIQHNSLSKEVRIAVAQ